MRSWLSVLIADAMSKKRDDIPIAPSLYSLSNKMDNSLLAVRDINHKYIVVEKEECFMKELLFLLVLFVSNVIQAITGFAGTVLAMPPSVYLLGLDHAKVVLNVMAWLSGLMIAVTGYRHINWKELLKMSAVMLVGMFAGIQICRIVKSENILLTIYGIIIVVVALKNLCIHTEKKLPDFILWIVLILAGIIHGMFVSGGALLVIYATQVLKEKEEFRATVAPVWVVLNFFLMVTQFRSGLVGTADIRLICISILPLLIATWLGKKLVCKVSQKVFLNLTYILLLISGVSLIV